MPSMQARSCGRADQTPFYAESGGQVGDKGELKGANFSLRGGRYAEIRRAIGHIGKLAAGSLKVGDAVQADVDEARRARIRLNHSATHLMHAALRQVLGTHVSQKGSLVNDKVLRFDFSHNEAMKPEEIRAVEDPGERYRFVAICRSKPTSWISKSAKAKRCDGAVRREV